MMKIINFTKITILTNDIFFHLANLFLTLAIISYQNSSSILESYFMPKYMNGILVMRRLRITVILSTNLY